MPRKTRTPESLALNRENQRRSRARQRELLDDLQRRVREYERRDAQATLEMQRVARVVAADNAALRSLLAARGVEQAEVEAHLAAARGEVTGASSSVTDVSSSGVSSSGVSTPSCGLEPRRPSCSQTVASDVTYHAYPNEEFSEPTPMESVPATEPCKPPAPGKPTCCPKPPTPPPNPRPLDKIHCMEAATILAQIRGHPDTSAAQATLGCSANDNCMIRNTDLLDLMDDMT
ncbi:hypothetical protein ACJZ2D_010468 [Fusarium nematophilum]